MSCWLNETPLLLVTGDSKRWKFISLGLNYSFFLDCTVDSSLTNGPDSFKDKQVPPSCLDMYGM